MVPMVDAIMSNSAYNSSIVAMAFWGSGLWKDIAMA